MKTNVKKLMKRLMKRLMTNNEKIMKKNNEIRYPLNFIIFHYSRKKNDE